MNRKKKSNHSYQKLEERRVLTAIAYANDGHLVVKGDADGPVEITAVSGELFDQSYVVTDNGVEIGSFDEIGGNFKIELNQDGPAENDSVKIDLGKQIVENIVVRLGNGDNSFEIAGAKFTGADPVKRVIFEGGSGDDSVTADLVTGVILAADMGHGDDSLTASGNGNRMRFRGGQGEDSLMVAEDAFWGEASVHLGPGNDVVDIDGTIYDPSILAGAGSDSIKFASESQASEIFVHLGSGDNNLNVEGWIASSLKVRGGAGNDTVNFADTTFLLGDARIMLGSGNNTFNIAGNIGRAGSTDPMIMLLRGEDGDDEVNVDPSCILAGDMRSVLGNGTNSLDQSGDIDGDLVAISRNIDDAFSNFGDVDGRVYLAPGGQP